MNPIFDSLTSLISPPLTSYPIPLPPVPCPCDSLAISLVTLVLLTYAFPFPTASLTHVISLQSRSLLLSLSYSISSPAISWPMHTLLLFNLAHYSCPSDLFNSITSHPLPNAQCPCHSFTDSLLCYPILLSYHSTTIWLITQVFLTFTLGSIVHMRSERNYLW